MTPGDIISAQIRRTLLDGSPAELLFVLDRPSTPANEFALLFFGTDRLGIPIQPGVYTDAQRADFAAPGHPGLDVSFQNRGCNTLTGSFEIFDVTFGANPLRVSTFDAGFEQHCEGFAPALLGRFQFNIVEVTPIPEPPTIVLFTVGAFLLAACSVKQRRKLSVTHELLFIPSA